MLLGVCRQIFSDHHNPVPMESETFGFHLSDPTPTEVKKILGGWVSGCSPTPQPYSKIAHVSHKKKCKKLEYNGKAQEPCIEFSKLDNALKQI